MNEEVKDWLAGAVRVLGVYGTLTELARIVRANYGAGPLHMREKIAEEHRARDGRGMKTPEEVAAEMVGADGWVDNAVRLLEPAAYPGVRGIIAALITHSRAEGATAERERLAAHAEQPAEEVAGEMVSADGWIDNTVRLLEPVSHSELRGILTRLIARERAASVALIADLNSALAEAESAADAEAIRLVAEVTRWRAVSGCETPEAFLGSTAGDRWDDTGPDPEPFV